MVKEKLSSESEVRTHAIRVRSADISVRIAAISVRPDAMLVRSAASCSAERGSSGVVTAGSFRARPCRLEVTRRTS